MAHNTHEHRRFRYTTNVPRQTQRRHLTSVFLIIFTHFMTMGISVHNPYTDYSTDIKTDNTLHR
jgi:hypothetical protein